MGNALKVIYVQLKECLKQKCEAQIFCYIIIICAKNVYFEL